MNSLPVEAESRMLCEAGPDVLGLELLMQVLDELEGLVPRQDETLKRFGLGDDRGHLRFDSREVLFTDLLLQIEIVVVAVAGGGAEGEADAVVESHHGAGHDVRARVSEDAEGFGVAVGEELDRDRVGLGKLVERAGRIADGAVDLGRNGGRGEALGDAAGDVESGRAGGEVFEGAVGELDAGHGRAERLEVRRKTQVRIAYEAEVLLGFERFRGYGACEPDSGVRERFAGSGRRYEGRLLRSRACRCGFRELRVECRERSGGAKWQRSKGAEGSERGTLGVASQVCGTNWRPAVELSGTVGDRPQRDRETGRDAIGCGGDCGRDTRGLGFRSRSELQRD
jgi:hypothetical protein